jgi:hypothetical protein
MFVDDVNGGRIQRNIFQKSVQCDMCIVTSFSITVFCPHLIGIRGNDARRIANNVFEKHFRTCISFMVWKIPGCIHTVPAAACFQTLKNVPSALMRKMCYPLHFGLVIRRETVVLIQVKRRAMRQELR